MIAFLLLWYGEGCTKDNWVYLAVGEERNWANEVGRAAQVNPSPLADTEEHRGGDTTVRFVNVPDDLFK